MASVVTPERFASGLTFDEYVSYIATPENLAREGTGHSQRRDMSAAFRENYAKTSLNPSQLAALQWLVAQPGGPAKILVLSEDWSSDCRRDVPTFARIAEAGGLEMRIFSRDGARFSDANLPSIAEAPDSNADIMAEFLNHKDGNTWQSIPVAVFYDKDLNYLYHFTEYPAIYHKDPLVVGHIRGARPGETPEQTQARSDREFSELLASPFWQIWTSATVDEILSGLHRRIVLGKA